MQATDASAELAPIPASQHTAATVNVLTTERTTSVPSSATKEKQPVRRKLANRSRRSDASRAHRNDSPPVHLPPALVLAMKTALLDAEDARWGPDITASLYDDPASCSVISASVIAAATAVLVNYIQSAPRCWKAQHNLAVLLLRSNPDAALALLLDILRKREKISKGVLFTLSACYLRKGYARAARSTIVNLEKVASKHHPFVFYIWAHYFHLLGTVADRDSMLDAACQLGLPYAIMWRKRMTSSPDTSSQRSVYCSFGAKDLAEPCSDDDGDDCGNGKAEHTATTPSTTADETSEDAHRGGTPPGASTESSMTSFLNRTLFRLPFWPWVVRVRALLRAFVGILCCFFVYKFVSAESRLLAAPRGSAFDFSERPPSWTYDPSNYNMYHMESATSSVPHVDSALFPHRPYSYGGGAGLGYGGGAGLGYSGGFGRPPYGSGSPYGRGGYGFSRPGYGSSTTPYANTHRPAGSLSTPYSNTYRPAGAYPNSALRPGAGSYLSRPTSSPVHSVSNPPGSTSQFSQFVSSLAPSVAAAAATASANAPATRRASPTPTSRTPPPAKPWSQH